MMIECPKVLCSYRCGVKYNVRGMTLVVFLKSRSLYTWRVYCMAVCQKKSIYLHFIGPKKLHPTSTFGGSTDFQLRAMPAVQLEAFFTAESS